MIVKTTFFIRTHR